MHEIEYQHHWIFFYAIFLKSELYVDNAKLINNCNKNILITNIYLL